MSKIIFFCILSLLFSFVDFSYAACDPAATTNAASFLADCAKSSKDVAVTVSDGGGKEEVKKLVIKIAERILQLGALFAIGAIVWSGIRYTTSAGDDEKIKSAKNTMLYAVVGLILLLTAFPLVDIIIGFIYGLGS